MCGGVEVARGLLDKGCDEALAVVGTCRFSSHAHLIIFFKTIPVQLYRYK